MNQQFLSNDRYEILTPTGWEDFEGILFNEYANKSSCVILFDNGTSVTATKEHRFFINRVETAVSDLKVGDLLDSVTGSLQIVQITDTILTDTYDIFNATNHVIIANEIHSHQCDEFAFLQPNIASSFWTSISPTLATGGRAIITSTPNSDEDTFATIWKESQNKFDAFGNETDTGLGINGFHGFKVCINEFLKLNINFKGVDFNLSFQIQQFSIGHQKL